MPRAGDILTAALVATLSEALQPMFEEHRAAVRADLRRALAELRADAESPDHAAYSTRDAAAYIGVSERTIHRMRADGRLPAVRVGRQIRFRREDLDRYLAAHLET